MAICAFAFVSVEMTIEIPTTPYDSPVLTLELEELTYPVSLTMDPSACSTSLVPLTEAVELMQHWLLGSFDWLPSRLDWLVSLQIIVLAVEHIELDSLPMPSCFAITLEPKVPHCDANYCCD